MTTSTVFLIFWAVLCAAIMIAAVTGMTAEYRKMCRIHRLLRKDGPLSLTEIWERIGGSPLGIGAILRDTPLFEEEKGKWKVTP